MNRRPAPHSILLALSTLAAACGPSIIDGEAPDSEGPVHADESEGDDVAPVDVHAALRAGDIHERTIDGPDVVAPGESASIEITESGATFIKLRFGLLDLAPGDALELAGADGVVLHRLEESGVEVWAPSVDGDTVIVTLVAGPAADRGGFVVDRVGVGTVDLAAEEPVESQERSICGVDDKKAAACFDGPMANAARSVGRMLFPSGDSMLVCTGALVSANSHFLTNNHCVSTQAQADALEVRFNYQTTACETTTATPTTYVRGGKLLRTSASLDYSLLELPDNPAAQFGWLPIAATDVTVGTAIYIPQHPGGRRKQIAAQENGAPCKVKAVNQSFSGYASQANLSYTCDTEGGSSGSPVLLASSHKLVALHHLGGCNNDATYLRNIYPQISSYLNAPTRLTSGVAVTGLSGTQGSEKMYVLDVPAGATALEFAMSGGTGDADVYVRYGAQPTTTTYDFRPYRVGNAETVTPPAATAGSWYVMVRAYQAYSGVSLTASFTPSAGP